MKYGDFLLVVLGVALLASIGYASAVDRSIWFVPVILAVCFFVFLYKLKIEK